MCSQAFDEVHLTRCLTSVVDVVCASRGLGVPSGPGAFIALGGTKRGVADETHNHCAIFALDGTYQQSDPAISSDCWYILLVRSVRAKIAKWMCVSSVPPPFILYNTHRRTDQSIW